VTGTSLFSLMRECNSFPQLPLVSKVSDSLLVKLDVFSQLNSYSLSILLLYVTNIEFLSTFTLNNAELLRFSKFSTGMLNVISLKLLKSEKKSFLTF